MSAQTQARELLGDVIDDDSLVPLGERSAQEKQGSVYIPFPQPHARQCGIEQSTTVRYALHAPTGALLVLPPEVETDEIID